MTKSLRAEAPSAPAESRNPADPVRQREAAQALERRGNVIVRSSSHEPLIVSRAAKHEPLIGPVKVELGRAGGELLIVPGLDPATVPWAALRRKGGRHLVREWAVRSPAGGKWKTTGMATRTAASGQRFGGSGAVRGSCCEA